MFLSVDGYLNIVRSIDTTKNKNTIEKKVQFIILGLDALALLLAYHIALPVSAFVLNFSQIHSLEEFYSTANIRQLLYFVQCMGILFLCFTNGQYTKRIPWWSQVQTITKLTVFSFLIEGFASFALGMHYSRTLIFTNWALVFVLLIATRLVINEIKSRSKTWKLPTVIIGDEHVVADTLFALNGDPGMGLSPSSVLIRDKKPEHYDRDDFPEKYKNVPVLDGNSYCEGYIQKNPNNFYIISLETFRGKKRDQLVDFLNKNNVEFALIPAISRMSLYHTKPLYFFGNDVMLLCNKNDVATPLGHFLKGSMDRIGAFFALMIFSIPMSIVAMLMKLEGHKGSIMFKGTRIGKDGKAFRCWKFQTMEPGSDHLLDNYLAKNPAAKAHWNKYQKLDDDPRVTTRIARFIRKTSIDELPQLWNVLKGEMSLVGPRPILENQIADYGEEIDEYMSVKPGITGLWQASGRNGVSFQRRVLWDAWYVRNWSLWGDLVIILKTIKVVITGSGAS
ncbi:MAG: putative sugar transferase [Micavibrio sp.]|nr:MAG: putative sugar transferase [Micavibrio sp.]